MTSEFMLTTDDFDYTLPDELVAHKPLDSRSSSKLLRFKQGMISDHCFTDIAELLPKDSLVIMNDTKVVPSRLFGKTMHGGSIEIMLLEPIDSRPLELGCQWKALGKPMKKLKPDTLVEFSAGLAGKIIEKYETQTGPIVHIAFNLSELDFRSWLHQFGYIPLPPYIKRDLPLPASQSPDTKRYQTVFAQHTGSVAAPTAGLHFTNSILEDFARRGIESAKITLHVGGGTFLPVKAGSPSEHHMHQEHFTVNNQTYEAIVKAKNDGRPIIAVGTTSFRALQGFHQLSKSYEVEALLNRKLSTDIFIYPKHKNDKYQPWAVKGIITNFHQPKSTLFMLICSLVGYDNAYRIYDHAIKERYRFYSYGDTSLLWI